MSVRLLLTDEAWAEIAPLLATLKSRAGSPPALSDRMCIEAVRYLARPGTPGRDLPEDFGPWDAVYHRFRRWERRPAADCSLARHIFIDATLVCAHQHAAGALKKTADKPPRLWAALAEACPPQSMPAVAMPGEASRASSPPATVMRVPSLSPCLRSYRLSRHSPRRLGTRAMTATASESTSSRTTWCRSYLPSITGQPR